MYLFHRWSPSVLQKSLVGLVVGKIALYLSLISQCSLFLLWSYRCGLSKSKVFCIKAYFLAYTANCYFFGTCLFVHYGTRVCCKSYSKYFSLTLVWKIIKQTLTFDKFSANLLSAIGVGIVWLRFVRNIVVVGLIEVHVWDMSKNVEWVWDVIWLTLSISKITLAMPVIMLMITLIINLVIIIVAILLVTHILIPLIIIVLTIIAN